MGKVIMILSPPTRVDVNDILDDIKVNYELYEGDTGYGNPWPPLQWFAVAVLLDEKSGREVPYLRGGDLEVKGDVRNARNINFSFPREALSISKVGSYYLEIQVWRSQGNLRLVVGSILSRRILVVEEE